MSQTEAVIAIVKKGGFEARDGDWAARNEALIELQSLFRRAATTTTTHAKGEGVGNDTDQDEDDDEDDREEEDDDEGPVFDLEAWRALRLPLTGALKDLRSHLVREACALVACIAETLNSEDGHPLLRLARDGGRQLLRDVAPTMFELLSCGNKVNAKFVDESVRVVVRRCRFRHLVSTIAEYSARKSAHVRECCAVYCELVAEAWGPAYFARHDGLPTLERVVKLLLQDSSAEVRAAARDAFRALAASWPDRAAAAKDDLDPRALKLIEATEKADSGVTTARKRVKANVLNGGVVVAGGGPPCNNNNPATTQHVAALPPPPKTNDRVASSRHLQHNKIPPRSPVPPPPPPEKSDSRSTHREDPVEVVVDDEQPASSAQSAPRRGGRETIPDDDAHDDGAGTTTTTGKNPEKLRDSLPFRVGDRVRAQRSRSATVRFVGETSFSSGVWVGLELDAPDGKHDGTVRDRRYFACAPYRGLFVRPVHVAKLEPKDAAAPELALASRLACEHKRYLSRLLDELQSQLAAFREFELNDIDLDKANDFLASAVFAPDSVRAVLDAHAARVATILDHHAPTTTSGGTASTHSVPAAASRTGDDGVARDPGAVGQASSQGGEL